MDAEPAARHEPARGRLQAARARCRETPSAPASASRGRPQPAGVCGRPWVLPLPRGFDVERYRLAADRILDGRFDVFALENARLGLPARWNVDPKTGIEAPLEFGFGINYRDAARVGDIKYLWEISRHLELVTLAQAWHLTADERYARGAKVLIDSWLEACPYPRASTGARASSMRSGSSTGPSPGSSWAPMARCSSRGSRAGFSPPLARERLPPLPLHRPAFLASFLRQQPSRGRGDGALRRGAHLAPWPESSRWRRQAHAELTREALLQTFEDGVNKEQAVWYHHAVADMLLIAGLFARANGCGFDAAVLGSARVHARVPGEHHGCEWRRARDRRCRSGCVGAPGAGGPAERPVARRLPLAARERRRALPAPGISAEGRRARRQDALAPG